MVQGLWAVLLGRLTGRDDIVFGVTVAGRPPELDRVEQMMGLFINTLPLRVQLRPGEPIADMLDRIQDSQSRLQQYRHVGLAQIQRAAGGRELFDTLVIFENYPVESAQLTEPAADLRMVGFEGRDAMHYTLTLQVAPGERLYLSLALAHDPTRIERGRVEAILDYLEQLFEVVVACDGNQPADRLDDLAPLPSWPPPNSEVDRGVLPTPTGQAESSRPPGTPEEHMLCRLFAEVLFDANEADRCIGIDDSFFDLGGHSLTAIRLASRIRAPLGLQVDLRTLFQAPTVAELA